MEVKGLVVVEDAHCAAGRPEAGWLKAAEYVANKPILHHVLDALRSVGVREAVVASSACWSRQIRECSDSFQSGDAPRLSYVQQDAPLDLGGALKLAAPVIDKAPCVVHSATGLLEGPLEPMLRRLRSDAPDVIVAVHQGLGLSRHLNQATQTMLGVAELHPERAALSMAGLCFFGPDAIRWMTAAAWGSGDEADLTVVAERAAEAGGHLQVLFVEGWRSYDGDSLDLLELNRVALDRLPAEAHRRSDGGNRIEGRVLIDDSAEIRSSVIVGPAAIGPEAQIADAYIGPYTSIGAQARVEGAEIERSIIAAGASVMHVGGRLVASVVGRDARVFRDFSLPRAFRLRVGDRTEIGLC
jgi:glucose-1-phosphate thymidylyltransferase